MNRRNFLRTTTAAAAAFSTGNAFAALAADVQYRKNIGIQLYTLRGPLGKDPAGTLVKVAEMGYKQVEMYGFPNCKPLIDGSKAAGLTMNSTHFNWDSAVNPKDAEFSDFRKILDQAKEIGLKHLVVPSLMGGNRSSADAWKKTAENLNKAAEHAKAAGIELGYHNHAFEFQPMKEGGTGYEIFMKEFSKDMKFEVDVFWVKVAGIDPAELITKLSGRVTQLHLKDLKKDFKTPNFGGVSGDAYKELGNGQIEFEPILAAAKKAGVVHCHVEQDVSPDPLASVKQSIEWLAKL
ncbi:MAG: sugar phosphate isomerase/epimerase [Verrucomicrobiota bacterium]